MSRSPIPLMIADVSQFATQLRKTWPADPPGQAAALSLIAKAAGYRNHQHVKATAPDDLPLDKTAEVRVRDALRVFDDAGLMIRWPKKTSVQRLCLAWFWSRLPARLDMAEAQINAVLQAGAVFGDHVLLRRSLIDHRYVTRAPDGSVYRRVEKRPDPQERAVIRAVGERWLAGT